MCFLRQLHYLFMVRQFIIHKMVVIRIGDRIIYVASFPAAVNYFTIGNVSNWIMMKRYVQMMVKVCKRIIR